MNTQPLRPDSNFARLRLSLIGPKSTPPVAAPSFSYPGRYSKVHRAGWRDFTGVWEPWALCHVKARRVLPAGVIQVPEPWRPPCQNCWGHPREDAGLPDLPDWVPVDEFVDRWAAVVFRVSPWVGDSIRVAWSLQPSSVLEDAAGRLADAYKALRVLAQEPPYDAESEQLYAWYLEEHAGAIVDVHLDIQFPLAA